MTFDATTQPSFESLDPFTQGYTTPILEAVNAAFHMLAPETLARIVEDCARRKADEYSSGTVAAMGALFWQRRQRDDVRYRKYPPLTAYLGDDGKVYLREAS